MNDGLIPKNIDWSTFFHQSPDMYLTKNIRREKFSQIIKEVEKLFEDHNTKKKKELLLSDPLYVIKRIIKGKYYKPRSLWQLFRRYIRY